MSARASWLLIAAAATFLFAGVLLSRRIEPGITVDAVTLARETPALRFTPLTPGPHPIALLAHGVGASKETLFRFCESLATAGFECFAVDLPGHGQSALRFGEGNARTINEVSRALGHVDVFLGHSMGAYAGAESGRGGGLRPRLFIAVGALPDLGESAPPLLLLAGRFEEAVSPQRLRARERAGARLVLSPWSDHALEPYDPRLVDAAVEASSTAVGNTPPAVPWRWCWRLAGAVLGALGALVLGDRIPYLFPRVARVRGLLLSAIVILTIALVAGSWLGAAPIPRRVPVQLVAIACAAVVTFIAAKLRIPRWSFVALAAVLVIGCLLKSAAFLALLLSLFTLVLFGGTVVGAIAARGGTRRDGDVALAIFVGYAIGQWVPMVLW